MGKGEATVREATVADLDVIMSHRRGMFHDMGFCDGKALDAMETASAPLIKRGLEDGTYRGWLMEMEGRVISGGGLLILSYPPAPHNPNPRRAWIINVYTAPEHRRHGFARAIVETIIGWSRGQGYAWVSLHASDAGKGVYEALGFKPTNEMRLVLKER